MHRVDVPQNVKPPGTLSATAHIYPCGVTSRPTRAIPAARGAPSVDDAFGLLERAVRDGEVPGAVAAVGTVDGTLRRAHHGYAELKPALRVLREDALFDLASVTKIVATTTLAMRLIEQGVIFLNQRVAAVLPAFGAFGKDAVTVRHLLMHTSGMPSPARGWREQFSRGAPHPPILDLICRTPLERPTGEAVHYSDSGFFILVLRQSIVAALVRHAAPYGRHAKVFCRQVE